MPKVAQALDVLERGLSDGALGSEPFGRTDAYLVPILFYMRGTPEAGPMLAARGALSRYLDAQLQRPSVEATRPAPPE